jgi:membrane protease YdiL (CAAX protease family)
MSLERISIENPWIAGVNEARRRLPAWAVLVAGGFAAGAVGWLAQDVAPLAMTALSDRLPGALGEQASVALLYVIVFLPLWLVAATGGLAEGRDVWRTEHQPARAIAAGLLVGVGGFIVAVGVANAAGAIGAGPNGGGGGLGPALGLLVFGYQAGAEEALFRGWMQPVLCARLGPRAGVVIVAIVFGVLHLVGAPHGPLCMLNLMLAGLMFGLLALRSGGLWAAFFAHAGWNWTESCGFGLDPNPGLGPFGALTDLELVGNPLWSGGADAMNGSLALTIVLAAVVLALVALRPPATPSDL